MQEFRPLTAGEIVSFSWSLYRQRFGSLLAIGVLLVSIPSLMQWLPGVGWLMTFVLLLTELVATGAFIWIVASHCGDLQVSPSEAIRAAWGRFRTLVGMWLVFGIAVLTAAVVMIMIGSVILAVVAFDRFEQFSEFSNDLSSIPPGDLFMLLIWTLVMILPAIALAISWWAAPMVVMVEGRGAFDSLRRSWKLVLPNYLRTVGVLLLSLAVIGPPLVALYWFLPQYLAALLGSLWTVPLTAVIGSVLYLDLRARSEHLTPDVLAEELASPS